MHILLITSEDLNEKNTFASIFELAQAKALQELGHQVAILSVGYYTTKNLAKAFSFRLLSKQYDYYRFNSLSLSQILIEGIRSLGRSLTSKTTVRKFLIKEIVVYEALFNRFYFSLNAKGHGIWVHHGYKGFLEYQKDNGVPDLIHAHSRFLLGGLLAKTIKDNQGINYVLTEHSSCYIRNTILPFQVPMIKNVIECSEILIVVSSKLGKAIRKKLNKNYDFRIVPNILDPLFEEVALPKMDANKFVYLNVATLQRNKNQRLLIKALAVLCKKYSSVVLRIAGTGEELKNLKRVAETEGVKDKVEFLGHLSHEKVKEEMLAANAFVLSSFHETFGVVLIEALACGKPVIATKCGGPEDIITNQNGLLVPVNDVEAFSKAMIEVYEKKDKYNHDSIRKRCQKIYSGKAVANHLSEIYEKALVKRT